MVDGKFKLSSLTMLTHFLTVIYQAFCEPKALYNSVVSEWPRSQNHFFYALAAVVLVSIVKSLSITADYHLNFWSLFWVLLSAVIGLCVWLLVSLTFACMAFSLRSKARLLTLLILTGYASLPWVLVLPLQMLFGHIPFVGGLFYIIGVTLLLGWIFTLFIMALQVTYQIKPFQAIVMSFTPALLFILMQAWCAEAVVGVFNFLTQNFS